MKINRYIHDHNQVMEQIPLDKVEKFARIIKETHDNLGIVYAIGNGGSNSNASHMAEDLVKASKIRAIAIDSSPLITACGNDNGYDESFQTGLETLFKKGDLVIGISGSGDSKNIIRCLVTIDNVNSIALLGCGGGLIANRFGIKDNIIVDSSDMQIIEDVHLAIIHMIVRCLM